MANPTVPKQQMLSLLDKLANDDAFRTLFEKNPKAGLIAAGVSAAHVATFPAEQLAPLSLQSKEAFAAEHKRVADDIAEECMCMVVPHAKYGVPPASKR